MSKAGSSPKASGKGSRQGEDSSSDGDYVEDEEQEAERDWEGMREPEGWLLDNGHFSDVTISCGPRSYRLHKAVLARESTVLREKFLDPHETEDPVLDYDDEDFEGLLSMMYMGGNTSPEPDAGCLR